MINALRGKTKVAKNFIKKAYIVLIVLSMVSVAGAVDTLTPYPIFRALDSNGDPLFGGKLYTYETGTTTPKATTKSLGGASNTNPVILDGNGEANVWCDGVYRFRLDDADDVTQWTVDNINNDTQSLAINDIFTLEHETTGRHFAPDSSSYTDFSTAVSTIGGTETTLIISTGEAVDTNISIPSTLTLRFRTGGKLTVANTITLTMNGAIEAPYGEIIDGLGTVTGVSNSDYLSESWFNAAVNTVTLATSNLITVDDLTAQDDITATGNILCADPTTGNHVGDRAYNDNRYGAGSQQGFVQRAQFEYKDADEIYINPGRYHHNGTNGGEQMVYWDTQLTLTLTSLIGNKWTHVYIDDSALTPGTELLTASEFTDSDEDTSTPTYSESKMGYYNGQDRCIFSTRGTALDTQLIFYHDGGDYTAFSVPITDRAAAGLAASEAVTLTIPSYAERSDINLRGYDSTIGENLFFGYAASPTWVVMTGAQNNNAYTSTGLTAMQSTVYIDTDAAVSYSVAVLDTMGWYFPVGM